MALEMEMQRDIQVWLKVWLTHDQMSHSHLEMYQGLWVVLQNIILVQERES